VGIVGGGTCIPPNRKLVFEPKEEGRKHQNGMRGVETGRGGNNSPLLHRKSWGVEPRADMKTVFPKPLLKEFKGAGKSWLREKKKKKKKRKRKVPKMAWRDGDARKEKKGLEAQGMEH